MQLEQVCRELRQSGMPSLWLPSQDSVIEVARIPWLGTGKPDLKQLKALALAKLWQSSLASG